MRAGSFDRAVRKFRRSRPTRTISDSLRAAGTSRKGNGRLLVLRREGVRVVLPADEVSGVQRFHSKEFKEVPTTVSKAATAHSRAVLSWSGHVVGLLDEHLLFRTLQGSLG